MAAWVVAVLLDFPDVENFCLGGLFPACGHKHVCLEVKRLTLICS